MVAIFSSILYDTLIQITTASNIAFDIILEMLTQEDLQAQGVDVALRPLSQDQLELQLHGFLKKEIANTSSRLEWLRYQPRTKF